MKKVFNYATSAILLALVLSFAACSDEEPLNFQVDEEQTLTINSTTTNLMRNTVANDGSFDNIVDGSSCFNIRFPYVVSINELEITINSVADLALIEEVFDAIQDDDDILDISFPITILLADFTEVIINGAEDLREIAAQCIEGGADEDIECIDFVYPVILFTFNPNFDQTGSVLVDSDKELRRFFAGLSETDLISIEFPVLLEMFDGTEVTVTTNAELAAAIEGAKETCDEDDDNDHNDDDFTKERLDKFLVECPWLVKELKSGNENGTEQYADYLLNFEEDGTVIIRDRAGTILNGKWMTLIADFRVVLKLEVEILIDFNLDWFVYDIGADRIKLFAGEGDEIIMKNACEYEMEECSEAFIKETLASCRWVISSPNTDFTGTFNFDFSDMNIHVRDPNETAVDEGNWEISGTTLTLNDLSMTFANFIGDWEVVECSAIRFKLKRGEEYFTIEKDCE